MPFNGWKGELLVQQAGLASRALHVRLHRSFHLLRDLAPHLLDYLPPVLFTDGLELLLLLLIEQRIDLGIHLAADLLQLFHLSAGLRAVFFLSASSL